MTQWEVLQEWLFDTIPLGGSFTHSQLRAALGLDGAEATLLIQSHLRAQRSPHLDTLYVIHRTDRTTRATWHVGIRTNDAREISHVFFDDVRVKFMRAVEPDLEVIAAKNPHAARRCRRIVEAIGDGAMVVLRAAVDGGTETDPETG